MNRLAHLLVRAASASATAALLAASPFAAAQNFSYISPAELKQKLESPAKPMLVDIQVEKDFAEHHIPGAVATYAYPAKSDDERAKLKPALAKILASKDEVVIVCPAGGGGAKNTWEFLKSQGVPENRMKILEKGQKGWPYAELTTKGK